MQEGSARLYQEAIILRIKERPEYLYQ